MGTSMEPEWVEAFAAVVTALTAGAAVVSARKELQAWRTQRRDEKRALVAGEALVAASDVWTALQTAISKDGWDDGVRDSDHIKYLFKLLSVPSYQQFRSARVQVEIFLSPQATTALERLSTLRSEIWDLLEAAESHCGQCGMIEADTSEVRRTFEALQGAAMRARLLDSVEETKRTLRPYVLYDRPMSSLVG